MFRLCSLCAEQLWFSLIYVRKTQTTLGHVSAAAYFPLNLQRASNFNISVLGLTLGWIMWGGGGTIHLCNLKHPSSLIEGLKRRLCINGVVQSIICINFLVFKVFELWNYKENGSLGTVMKSFCFYNSSKNTFQPDSCSHFYRKRHSCRLFSPFSCVAANFYVQFLELRKNERSIGWQCWANLQSNNRLFKIMIVAFLAWFSNIKFENE